MRMGTLDGARVQRRRNRLVPITSQVPVLVRAAGERARTRFWEFFAANIRNKHTRRAYAQATREFLTWCETAGGRVDPLT